ncbi:Conserved protein of unknown function, possible toxin [Mycobacterium canettii CIPT 140070017]|nr:Conserved protein of unknown function, possible toxin [Mycobacterium canettii CIPT 140070017]
MADAGRLTGIHSATTGPTLPRHVSAEAWCRLSRLPATPKSPIPGVVAGGERWSGRRFEGAGPAGWIRRCATSPLPS